MDIMLFVHQTSGMTFYSKRIESHGVKLYLFISVIPKKMLTKTTGQKYSLQTSFVNFQLQQKWVVQYSQTNVTQNKYTKLHNALGRETLEMTNRCYFIYLAVSI